MTLGKLKDTCDLVRLIIIDISQKDFTPEELDECMNTLTGLGEWNEVRDCILRLLLEVDKSLWNEVITTIYYLQNRGKQFDETKTIALLYNCLTHYEGLDSNLIWTITRSLKRLPYLSEWDPYDDHYIIEEMNRMEQARNASNS